MGGRPTVLRNRFFGQRIGMAGNFTTKFSPPRGSMRRSVGTHKSDNIDVCIKNFFLVI